MTTKLRLLRVVAGPWGHGQPGDIVEVPKHLADGLIQMQHAQHPDAPFEDKTPVEDHEPK